MLGTFSFSQNAFLEQCGVYINRWGEVCLHIDSPKGFSQCAGAQRRYATADVSTQTCGGWTSSKPEENHEALQVMQQQREETETRNQALEVLRKQGVVKATQEKVEDVKRGGAADGQMAARAKPAVADETPGEKEQEPAAEEAHGQDPAMTIRRALRNPRNSGRRRKGLC